MASFRCRLGGLSTETDFWEVQEAGKSMINVAGRSGSGEMFLLGLEMVDVSGDSPLAVRRQESSLGFFYKGTNGHSQRFHLHDLITAQRPPCS